MEGTTSLYIAMVLCGELPQPTDPEDGDDDNKDDDAGLAHGPKSLSSIELACTASLFSSFQCHILKGYLQIHS